MSADVSVILGIVCLGVALVLLVMPRLRRQSHVPRQQHALIASHMRTYGGPRRSG